MSSRQLKNLLSRGVPHTCPRPLHPTLIPRNLFIPLLLNFNCTSTYSTSKSNSSLYTSTSVTSPRFSPSPIFVPPHQNSSNPIDTPTNTRNFSTTTRSAMATATPFFSNEPDGPKLMTAFPGPKSQDAIKKLDAVFDTRSLNMICDYGQSRGNYIADCDGNLYLDLYSQIASIAVGYNNPHLREAASSPEMIDALINRPALGNFPSCTYSELLTSSILKYAPKGLNQVFTALAGSDANETAYKAAFMFYRRRERGGAEFSPEELSSCMVNAAPGSPELAIMSFKRGFHGRLFATLSTTRSKPIHKMDIPSFNWPVAPFPELKYPLEEHIQENEAEEKKCIEEAERIITSWHCPVVAIVIEPVQSEGGDNHASPSYFRGLREMTKRLGVLMIVDEVQTGIGATGRFWAHDHWELETPPDLVTFSKKAQTAGYFFGDERLRPDRPYRQFNTWMGDPSKALIFRAITEEIEKYGLVEHTARVGNYLYSGLEALSKKYPGQINNLRGKGQGTFIAWDSPQRDEFLKKMKHVGVNIGGSGEMAVRLRPMLVFQEHHADIFFKKVEEVLSA
ncbi:aminotransferase class-III-domain-containing protein [Pyronema domesticum]|nr:aminotransferase class-III-domain-containing protein [Pyronema domesticum]